MIATPAPGSGQQPQDDEADRMARVIAAMVVAQLGGPAVDAWWTSREVVLHTGHGRTLVATALADGELHSHQRGRQGKRRTKRSVVDAWMQGATSGQQVEVCGCQRVGRPPAAREPRR